MSFPRMSLHIGDYKRKTGHLRALGHGAYLMLIMHYWSTGGLPNEDSQLAAIACCTDNEWKKLRPLMFQFFDENWKHERIEEELIEAQRKYDARAKAGSEGGKAKAKNKQNPSNATAKSKQPITDNLGYDERDARASDWRSSDGYRVAKRIAEFAGKLDDLEINGWGGATFRAQQWLNQGWPEEVIVLSAQEQISKKNDGAPNSFAYFENGIREAITRLRTPLPTPKSEVHNGKTQNGSALIAAADSLIATIDRWQPPGPAEDCCGADAHPVRLLPKGGC